MKIRLIYSFLAIAVLFVCMAVYNAPQASTTDDANLAGLFITLKGSGSTNATVKATNLSTGMEYLPTYHEDDTYTFSGIPNGTYSLCICTNATTRAYETVTYFWSNAYTIELVSGNCMCNAS